MLRSPDQKIVIVTRRTRMQALREKFGTGGQAKFAMKRSREIEYEKAMAAAPPGAAAPAAGTSPRP